MVSEAKGSQPERHLQGERQQHGDGEGGIQRHGRRPGRRRRDDAGSRPRRSPHRAPEGLRALSLPVLEVRRQRGADGRSDAGGRSLGLIPAPLPRGYLERGASEGDAVGAVPRPGSPREERPTLPMGTSTSAHSEPLLTFDRGARPEAHGQDDVRRQCPTCQADVRRRAPESAFGALLLLAHNTTVRWRRRFRTRH